jgi:hypothetical protein
MNRLPLPYRLLSALLCVTLLAGVVLPAVQHACAMSMMEAEGHEMASHSEMAPHHGAMHAPAQEAPSAHTGRDAEATPASEAAFDCLDRCLDGDCCTLESAPADAPDLRLPLRAEAGSADLPIRTAERVAVPTPDRRTASPVPLDSPPLSSVRLHVWTATFLT